MFDSCPKTETYSWRQKLHMWMWREARPPDIILAGIQRLKRIVQKSQQNGLTLTGRSQRITLGVCVCRTEITNITVQPCHEMLIMMIIITAICSLKSQTELNNWPVFLFLYGGDTICKKTTLTVCLHYFHFVLLIVIVYIYPFQNDVDLYKCSYWDGYQYSKTIKTIICHQTWVIANFFYIVSYS